MRKRFVITTERGMKTDLLTIRHVFEEVDLTEEEEDNLLNLSPGEKLDFHEGERSFTIMCVRY